MEPTTLVAIFAAAFVVKLAEKAVETLGEKTAEKGSALLSVLQRKDPEAVTAIEQIAQKSDLTEQNFVDAEIRELVDRVEQLANADPEVKAAVIATATTVQQQPGAIPSAIVNMGNKIGVLNQGTIVGQTNHITI